MTRVLFSVVVAFAVLACGGAAWWLTRTPQPIRVGVLHSLTGTMAISERSLVDAARLAVEEINAAGGVMERSLEMIVADGQSDPQVFAAEAERLIVEDRVAVIFGCWTSVCRKAVKEVVERYDHLLFYPLQYEGLEESPNIIYLGAAPNQQILPAVRWSIGNLGQRFYLVGSNYLFPRAANAIIRDQLNLWSAQIVGEDYIPLGSQNVASIVRSIVETKPSVVLNTLNGDSNVAFFEALLAAGVTADEVPTMSFSIGEEELRQLPAEAMTGHYAAWNYFESVPGVTNERFVEAFKRRFGINRVTSDPIEATYLAVHLFAEAVTAAGSDDPQQFRAQVRERSIEGPGGFVFVDGRNQHTWKTVRIGRMRADGQFDLVSSSGSPIAPAPFPPFRSKDAWATFLQQLQAGWGGQWESPRDDTVERP